MGPKCPPAGFVKFARSLRRGNDVGVVEVRKDRFSVPDLRHAAAPEPPRAVERGRIGWGRASSGRARNAPSVAGRDAWSTAEEASTSSALPAIHESTTPKLASCSYVAAQRHVRSTHSGHFTGSIRKPDRLTPTAAMMSRAGCSYSPLLSPSWLSATVARACCLPSPFGIHPVRARIDTFEGGSLAHACTLVRSYSRSSRFFDGIRVERPRF